MGAGPADIPAATAAEATDSAMRANPHRRLHPRRSRLSRRGRPFVLRPRRRGRPLRIRRCPRYLRRRRWIPRRLPRCRRADGLVSGQQAAEQVQARAGAGGVDGPAQARAAAAAAAVRRVVSRAALALPPVIVR